MPATTAATPATIGVEKPTGCAPTAAFEAALVMTPWTEDKVEKAPPTSLDKVENTPPARLVIVDNAPATSLVTLENAPATPLGTEVNAAAAALVTSPKTEDTSPPTAEVIDSTMSVQHR